jgi:hypothetical protein
MAPHFVAYSVYGQPSLGDNSGTDTGIAGNRIVRGLRRV